MITDILLMLLGILLFFVGACGVYMAWNFDKLMSAEKNRRKTDCVLEESDG